MKYDFVKQYYQTILLIIEDRPKYEIPVIFYQMMIFISYIQIIIYVISPNEVKAITDFKMGAIADILQMISLKNILVLRNQDYYSLIVYLITQGFMYFYFIYVGVLTFLKQYMPALYENYKKAFISINQILNMYFALYIQTFFTQYVEMNSSIMFCSNRSLFSTNRLSSTLTAQKCTIATWQTILGGIGLTLTLVTGWIATYFFRNYEFLEYNLIKRKMSNQFLIIICLKFSLSIVFYSNLSNERSTKHIISHIIGCISLLDFFTNFPYSDMRVSRFYLRVISWYYALVILSSVWIYTNNIHSDELFYFGLLAGTIAESFCQAVSNFKYERYLLTEVKANYVPAKIDFYLEEFIRLAQDSAKDELAKVKLLKLIKSHQQTCEYKECPCKLFDKQNQNSKTLAPIMQKSRVVGGASVKDSQSMKSNNSTRGLMLVTLQRGRQASKDDSGNEDDQEQNEIEFEDVLLIVDGIFKFFLSQNIISKDQAEYEHLSLKYITFMIKYLKNYTRANYELKLLQYKRDDFSFYFKMIANIISSKIQEVISQMNIHLELRRKDEITVTQLMGIDDITLTYMPKIYTIMGEKQRLWSSLQKGFRNMNDFQSEALKLMRLVRDTRNRFIKEMHLLQRSLKVQSCIQFQKLYLVFYLFVMNDNIRAYELEMVSQDLRRRDSLKELDMLSNENFLRENIITLTISISQNIGKIVSKKDDKTAEFFGFTKQNFLKIQRVNELMPQFFSRVHDKIIKQFVSKGESQFIKSSKFTYCRDYQGFIIPIKLYLDFSFFNPNDFQVNGSLLKVHQQHDFIIFHRSGKILGLTKKISQFIMSLTVQKGGKMPSGDLLSQNLHVHLLLPRLAKRIFKRKEQILSNLRSEGDILLQDRKGQIIVGYNPLITIKKLQSYVIKMNQSAVTKSKVGSENAFDQLDLFSEQSFSLINNYRKQEVENSSAGGLSSGRLSGKLSNRSATSKASLSGRDNSKFKIRFNYSLLYSTISSSFNSEQDLFFSLKMNDLNINKVKEKQRSYFRVNLCTYLVSTCLVNKLDNKFKNILHGLTAAVPQNEHSRISQSLNEWSFTDQDIPARLVKLAILNDNQIQAMNEEKLKQKEKKDKNINRINNDKSEQETDNAGDHHDDSSDEDDYNDYTDDEDNEDSVGIDTLRNKKKIIDYYNEKIENQEISKLLTDYSIKEEEVLKLDPNYKVKKVIQFKSLSSIFGRAFEEAVLQAMLEIQDEKNLLLTSQLEESNVHEIATFRDFSNSNQQQQGKSYPEKPILKKEDSKADGQRQNSNNDISPRIQFKQVDLSATNMTLNDNLPSFNMPPYTHYNEIGIDISSDNLDIHKGDNKLFDVSSRPLFKQQQELLGQDNEILITPSIEDNRRYIQESNAEIFAKQQSKKEKEKDKEKEMTKTATLGVSSNLDLTHSVGSKYRTGSQMDVTKLTQSQSDQKQPNNVLLSSWHQKQLEKSGINSNSQGNSNNPNHTIHFNMDQNHKDLTNEDKKLLDPTNIKSDQTKDNDEAIDDQSGKLHEKVVVQLLNQKGMIGVESINKGSVHSSSKSSRSYGGNFLREIITMCKIPRHSYQYAFLLVFFIVVFLTLNLTNLMIIESDMQYFTNNVIVLRQPRKFLRSYAKVLFGRLVQFEIDAGVLLDPTGSIMNTTNFYITDGLAEYVSLIQTYQPTMIQYLEQLQATLNSPTRTLNIYTNQVLNTQDIDFTLQLGYHEQYIYGSQNNQTQGRIIDSYLYLRANFFQFSSDILTFGNFLVSNVLTTVDNLIVKFIIIAICAIFGVIAVALISLPILRLINLYEEKIMMIVSRINFDNSQVEKLKLSICQQLVDIDQLDWLKYNYSDIICLRFDQFDVNVVNSQHDLTKVQSKKESDKLNITNILKTKQMLLSNAKTNSGKETQQQHMKHTKAPPRPKKKVYDDAGSSYKDYQLNMKNSIQKNYVLQTKILNQRLSVLQRFIPLFLLTVGNTIYFLVIIIYLSSSKDLLKIPVQFNQRTIQIHIAQSTLKVSSELLTFDFIIQQKYQTSKTNDLDSYQKKMNDMIDLCQTDTSLDTQLVYGSNPFPANILNQFKDFEQGNICQYLVKYSCDQSVVGNQYSLNFLLTEQIKVINAYPQVITAADAPLNLLIAYSNSHDHLVTFINSFLINDEATDLYSSYVNLSIGTISNQVQVFLEQYLSIFGFLFGGVIIVICLLNWHFLYQRIQLMNLLLTFIPEEKLLEEVTLQMLKSLIRM